MGDIAVSPHLQTPDRPGFRTFGITRSINVFMSLSATLLSFIRIAVPEKCATDVEAADDPRDMQQSPLTIENPPPSAQSLLTTNRPRPAFRHSSA